MKPEEDAFGQKLWAAYKGEEVFEIVERDDGYIDAMKIKGYFADFQDWSPAEQKAMDYVRGRVLDIGCGAGRHALYLQKKGLDVLGIDVSPLAVKVCKSRGLRKAIVMSIEEVDFERNSFDTIIMMGNNFGLLGSFKNARRLLKRFHEMTSQNAITVASTRDPYKTDNQAHLAYHKQNKKKGRMAGQVRIRSRFRKYVGRWFDYLMVSKEEVKQILEGTGWNTKKIIEFKEPNYIAIIQKTS
ncbi:methyltransferase domain-containing protein [Candidatus Bathyarchaeota archaeon]|nr:methyltransferase domain-containing protein [Candidatus Bathyarchaeota archaeon]